MPEIRRFAISDGFAVAGVPEHSPVGHAARILGPVRATAVAMDQVVNRSAQHTRRGVDAEAEVAAANAADLRHAAEQAEILRVGLAVCLAMADGIARQLGIPPTPDPDEDLQAKVKALEAERGELLLRLAEADPDEDATGPGPKGDAPKRGRKRQSPKDTRGAP